MRKTKIVCTLGPSTDEISVLKDLFNAGMNVGRLNFSHSNHKDQLVRVEQFKQAREELNIPAALLLDTKGPEIRIGKFENGKIALNIGDSFTLDTNEVIGNKEIVHVTYKGLPQDLKVGNTVLIDDGLIALEVMSIKGTKVNCKALNQGSLGDNKGVNIPGITVKMPFVSQKDFDDVLFGIKHDFDFIAASFVRNAEDIKELRKILEDKNCTSIQIIAKIENRDGVNNIDDIIRASDGIMVARGDMGVEIPFEELPAVQKSIIKKCYLAGKPVITATQMLDSMTNNPRPTRAEITDVANAIYDGTSALMLSGETSVGKYAVETVKTMSTIAVETEKNINYVENFENLHTKVSTNVTNAISHATCSTAHALGASAIISITESGSTAKMVSKYRPAVPIIATTMTKKISNQLALSWGIIPVITKLKNQTDEMFEEAISGSENTGIIQSGDLVVITGGIPVGISGTTNMMKTHIVGNVLVEGFGVNEKSGHGIVVVVNSENINTVSFDNGDILVISKTIDEMLPMLKHASAIVTEETDENSQAVTVAKALGIPAIYAASQATKILKSGTAVTVNPKKGYVASGVIRD